MNKNDKSRDYTPLLCRLQLSIAQQAADGDPRIPCIADLLNIRCHMLGNGGRFEDARDSLLNSELARGAACLTVELAQIILAGDAPDFWHWEGDTLVVDFYSVAHEAALLAMKNGGRAGGLQSGISRNEKKGASKDASKGASKGATKGATNNKERNTTFTGSISKAGPSAGARGPALDGAATAAGDDEPATDEEMQPARAN